jgi:predicted NBD/HSP70 family sugar kinase
MSEITRDQLRNPAGVSPLSARVLDLVASGQAVTRTDLGAALGAPASTISLAVNGLVELGLIAEEGTQGATGGRPRKVLRLGGTDEFAVAADLGGSHARIGIVLPGGEATDIDTVPFSLSDGPEKGLARLAELFEELADGRGHGTLRAIGMSLPGPVDIATGGVDQPSRMPGWHRFPAAAWMEERFGLPVAVDNDANLMAIAEHVVHAPEHVHTIMVKAGSAIGTGIIVDGHIYRGATGAAGDITHVRIDAADSRPCSCGNTGCLETIASGAALVRTLREQDVDVENILDVVKLVERADPLATMAVRRAGHYLGEVLAANVNFFNPNAVYLGGILSTLEPFVAAVRSELYEACHPLVTQHLTIARASLGADAGLIGAGVSALQLSLARALDTTLPAASKSRNHVRIP